MPNAPAQKQAIASIAASRAAPNDRSLRSASGMKSEIAVILRHTIGDRYIVRLLEADAISVIVPHGAMLDLRPEGSTQENPTATATIQMFIRVFVSFNGYVACTGNVGTESEYSK